MKKENIKIGLQFFADAGTVVNATTQYVNAYTGEATSFETAGKSLSPTMKEFYDTALLENARPQLFYAQFAKRQPLPANHHGSVEWRKFDTFARAEKLTEGVIPTGQKFGLTKISGSIDQYGTYTTISDRLELHAYDPIIMGCSEEMGASGAETQEKLIRDALLVGTNVLYCDKVAVADGAVTEVTTQSGLVEGSGYHCYLTPTMINKAVTIMKRNRVPQINGRYYAVIHPSVAFDLRQSKDWIEAHKYAAPEQLFNGEIGELHGVRFVENVFAPVLKGEDLASDARTLKVNYQSGYTGAITSIAFDGGTVAAHALKDRYISINGVVAQITDNTDSTLTVVSTNFGTVADDSDILPADFGAGDIAAYATYFFGKDGFGIIDPEGGGMEMIIKDKGQVGGPLDQFSTVGYKFETNGATILYQERILRVMSCSSFSASEAAN